MIILLLAFAGMVHASDSLIFIIRVDDVQSRNNAYLPRSISDFEQVVAARGGKVTWAVIPHRLIEPQNMDGTLSAALRRSVAAGHEVALHGYNHICLSCNYTNHEMYCTTYRTHHSYEIQTKMVSDGMQLLRDSLSVTPTCFVPPGHQADTLTYQVLLDQGFQWISTTGTPKQNIYKRLFNLSPQSDYTWALSNTFFYSRLEETLADVAEKGLTQGYYCLLLHDPFIRPGYENGLVIRWTGELLDSLIVRYGERISFKTVSQAAEYFNRVTSIISDLHDPVLQTTFDLEQNYPNPFNQTTIIPVYLHAPGDIRLDIYDIRGRLVFQDKKDRLHTGNQVFHWDASDAGSGIYFYRIAFTSATGSRHIATKQCLLIK